MNKLKAVAGNTSAHAAEGKQPTTINISKRGEIVHHPGPSIASFELNVQREKMDGRNQSKTYCRFQVCSRFGDFVVNQMSQLIIYFLAIRWHYLLQIGPFTLQLSGMKYTNSCFLCSHSSLSPSSPPISQHCLESPSHLWNFWAGKRLKADCYERFPPAAPSFRSSEPLPLSSSSSARPKKKKKKQPEK